MRRRSRYRRVREGKVGRLVAAAGAGSPRRRSAPLVRIQSEPTMRERHRSAGDTGQPFQPTSVLRPPRQPADDHSTTAQPDAPPSVDPDPAPNQRARRRSSVRLLRRRRTLTVGRRRSSSSKPRRRTGVVAPRATAGENASPPPMPGTSRMWAPFPRWEASLQLAGVSTGLLSGAGAVAAALELQRKESDQQHVLGRLVMACCTLQRISRGLSTRLWLLRERTTKHAEAALSLQGYWRQAHRRRKREEEEARRRVRLQRRIHVLRRFRAAGWVLGKEHLKAARLVQRWCLRKLPAWRVRRRERRKKANAVRTLQIELKNFVDKQTAKLRRQVARRWGPYDRDMVWRRRDIECKERLARQHLRYARGRLTGGEPPTLPPPPEPSWRLLTASAVRYGLDEERQLRMAIEEQQRGAWCVVIRAGDHSRDDAMARLEQRKVSEERTAALTAGRLRARREALPRLTSLTKAAARASSARVRAPTQRDAVLEGRQWCTGGPRAVEPSRPADLTAVAQETFNAAVSAAQPRQAHRPDTPCEWWGQPPAAPTPIPLDSDRSPRALSRSPELQTATPWPRQLGPEDCTLEPLRAADFIPVPQDPVPPTQPMPCSRPGTALSAAASAPRVSIPATAPQQVLTPTPPPTTPPHRDTCAGSAAEERYRSRTARRPPQRPRTAICRRRPLHPPPVF
eukprot:TRINITY_DN14772_c0_g1_i1.p1 TRINITY_DN14772_c0_g1~~TRINITY_DN14772_c0_g1_i1.p1  ORF type:complete len:711 (+),score=154.53 TRINITY_DN14772_c0_g1_i1:86-2134(+)